MVSRPLGAADELLADIRAAGGEPWHQPMLRILPLSPDEHGEQIAANAALAERFVDVDKVFFISANAAEHGLAFLRASGVELRQACFAIGAATAARLAEAGVVSEHAGINSAMNSESLLALPALQSLSGQRIVIVRGLGGRQHLAKALSARGAEVEALAVYRREAPELDADSLRQRLSEQDCICLNSGETLQHFAEYFPECRETPVIVPSERVLDQAKVLGFQRIIQADNAGTPATLRALAQLAV